MVVAYAYEWAGCGGVDKRRVKMNMIFKISMFITSFLPLWISIIFVSCWEIVDYAIKNWCSCIKITENIIEIIKNNAVQFIVLLTALLVPFLCMVSLSFFLKSKRKTENKPVANVENVKKANKLTSEFLLAYILPMIAFDFSSTKDIILFLIYFFVLAILCIGNNNIYTNIFLEMKKYKLYECNVERTVLSEKTMYENTLVISKLDLTEPINKKIEYYDFENYIYINLKEPK